MSTPGESKGRRVFPERVVMAKGALDQTSSPFGDHATPRFASRALDAHLALGVHDLEPAVVVAARRMIDERDVAAVGRDADAAHPSGRRVDRLADRVLEALEVADVVRDGEGLPVGRPIGVLHVLEDRPGRAAAQGDARERTRALVTRRGSGGRARSPSRRPSRSRGRRPEAARAAATPCCRGAPNRSRAAARPTRRRRRSSGRRGRSARRRSCRAGT